LSRLALRPATGRRRLPARSLLFLLGCLWLGYAAIVLIAQTMAVSRATLTWKTETEVNTAGFNVYRGEQPDGPWQLLTTAGPLPARGSSMNGSEYRYIDRGLSAGHTYYYVIEEVEYDMTTHRYTGDAVALTVDSWRGAAIPLFGAGLVIGLAVIWLGRAPTREAQ